MISDEELQQRPLTAQLCLLEDETNPNVFGALIRHPDGTNKALTFTYKDGVPIDEEWMKATLKALIEHAIIDLRVHHYEHLIRSTNWESVTAALRRLLGDWNNRRIDRARQLATPKVLQ